MGRAGSRIPSVGITWEEIKSKLETEGAKNKAYDSDVDGVFDLAAIPVLDWTKLQFFGVRQEILSKFSDPKILIATSSMNLLLASADKVEAASGNISATSQELTIIGGSSSAAGNSWVYWNLPEAATKVYAVAQLKSVNAPIIEIDFADGDGSTRKNPPDFYRITIEIPKATQDSKLDKNVAGTWTTLAYEAVDLSYDTYYNVEFYFEGDGAGNNNLKAWRDGVLKIDISDSEPDIPSILSVRINVYDASTSAAQSGKVKGPVVIIYE